MSTANGRSQNYPQADGSMRISEVLRPCMGGRTTNKQAEPAPAAS
ncbi:hypothetical protein [Ferriphaselus sp. R-1]|nr:hypothetical protein [Ferriphaselus sp. R-1]